MNQTNEIIWLGNITPTKTRANPNQGRVYDVRGIAPALHTCGGGNLQPFVIIKINGVRKDNDGNN